MIIFRGDKLKSIDNDLPLKGINILELGVIVSAPTAGLIFADLGANVIKVENTGYGDPNRENTGAPGTGQFDFLNREKKSISLNLKTDDGRKIFLQLATKADVIIENLAPRVADSLGVSFRNVVKVNPRIIYGSIKGFGKGKFESRKMTDYPTQAESGLAYMTGLKGRPMRAGASVLDMMAANMLVIAVLSKMLKGFRSGKTIGEEITVGMFETGAFLVGPIMSRSIIKSEAPMPLNATNFRWAIYDFFDIIDGGKIFIGIINENQWGSFCTAFGMEELEVDQRFKTNEVRLLNKEKLTEIIQENILKLRPEELFHVLERTDILYAKLNRPDELVNYPHLSDKLLSYESIYDNRLVLHLPRIPIEGNSFEGIKAKRAPLLGENTFEILFDLGYSEDQISQLKKLGCIYF